MAGGRRRRAHARPHLDTTPARARLRTDPLDARARCSTLDARREAPAARQRLVHGAPAGRCGPCTALAPCQTLTPCCGRLHPISCSAAGQSTLKAVWGRSLLPLLHHLPAPPRLRVRQLLFPPPPPLGTPSPIASLVTGPLAHAQRPTSIAKSSTPDHSLRPTSVPDRRRNFRGTCVDLPPVPLASIRAGFSWCPPTRGWQHVWLIGRSLHWRVRLLRPRRCGKPAYLPVPSWAARCGSVQGKTWVRHAMYTVFVARFFRLVYNLSAILAARVGHRGRPRQGEPGYG